MMVVDKLVHRLAPSRPEAEEKKALTSAGCVHCSSYLRRHVETHIVFSERVEMHQLRLILLTRRTATTGCLCQNWAGGHQHRGRKGYTALPRG
jgi:hypothetical protein